MASTNSDTHSPHGREAWEPVKVAGTWRAILGVFGLCLLTVAAVSTLTDDNELGTVACAVTGTILGLVAALGQWPHRVTWGDKTAEFRALTRVQKAVEDGGTPESIAAVAESVAITPLELHLADQLRRVGVPNLQSLRSLTLERLEVEAAGFDLEMIYAFEPLPGAADARLAFAPLEPLTQSIAVVVAVGETPGTGAMTRLVERVRAVHQGGFQLVLIVREGSTPRVEQEQFMARLEHAQLGSSTPAVFWGGVLGGSGLNQLRASLKKVLPRLHQLRAADE